MKKSLLIISLSLLLPFAGWSKSPKVKKAPAIVKATPKKVSKTDKKLQKQAEEKMKAIAWEMKTAKTVKQWIDQSNKNDKHFRRSHFSNRLSDPMPDVVLHGTRLFIFPKNLKDKNKPSSRIRLEAKVEKGQIQFYANNLNVTRKKNEDMEKWAHRVFGEFKGKKGKSKGTASMFEFFFTPAFANPMWDYSETSPNAGSTYWSAMAASMTASQWQAERDINDEQFYDVATFANYMTLPPSEGSAMAGLQCGDDNHQRFDWQIQPPAGPLFNVETYLDRSANPPLLRIWLNDPDSKTQVARYAIPVQPGSDGIPSNIMTWDVGSGENQNLDVASNVGDTWSVGATLHRAITNSGAQGVYTQYSDYYNEVEDMIALSDVANAACTNNLIQNGSGAPRRPAPSDVSR